MSATATLSPEQLQALRTRLDSGNPDFPLSDIRALLDSVADLQAQVEALTAPGDETREAPLTPAE